MLYSFLVFLSLSFTVLAVEEGVEGAGPTQTTAESAPQQTDARMVRQASPVLGYETLSVAGQEIDAAYIEETFGVRHGAIVFFHDQGAQLESPGVITPLRHQLADYGWSTLTVSLDLASTPQIMMSPNLADDKTTTIDTTDLPPVPNSQRVEAAMAFLNAKSIDRIIFLGEGEGGKLALEMLASNTFPIAGLIMVGVSELERNDIFATLEIPILEVYGSRDNEGVERAVKRRKAEMKRNLESDYTIREVMGANHDYYGLEPMLVTTVRSWLNANYIQRIFP